MFFSLFDFSGYDMFHRSGISFSCFHLPDELEIASNFTCAFCIHSFECISGFQTACGSGLIVTNFPNLSSFSKLPQSINSYSLKPDGVSNCMNEIIAKTKEIIPFPFKQKEKAIIPKLYRLIFSLIQTHRLKQFYPCKLFY